jgi:hypothetical protein
MGISINNPLGSIIDLVKDGLDRFIPDKSQAAQAKATLDQLKESDDAKPSTMTSKCSWQGCRLSRTKPKARAGCSATGAPLAPSFCRAGDVLLVWLHAPTSPKPP